MAACTKCGCSACACTDARDGGIVGRLELSDALCRQQREGPFVVGGVLPTFLQVTDGLSPPRRVRVPSGSRERRSMHFSLRDLTERVGVTQSAIYRHFKDLDDMSPLCAAKASTRSPKPSDKQWPTALIRRSGCGPWSGRISILLRAIPLTSASCSTAASLPHVSPVRCYATARWLVAELLTMGMTSFIRRSIDE